MRKALDSAAMPWRGSLRPKEMKPLEEMHFYRMPSPLGDLLLAAKGGMLCRIAPAEPSQPFLEDGEPPVLREARRQLEAYFAGRLRVFDLPLAPDGTDFQREVWCALQTVAYGEWISYGGLAALAGHPKAARAVGGACHANPLPIVIPCHRVLAAGGREGGYGWGAEAKRLLLRLEGISWRGAMPSIIKERGLEFKKGGGWRCCYDPETGRYTAETGGGPNHNLYEITKEIYDHVDDPGVKWPELLISQGRHLYMAVDDRCGPPYTVILDQDYKEICPWAKTVISGEVWPDDLTDAAVEVFASEANNREQRRARRAEREKAAAKKR